MKRSPATVERSITWNLAVGPVVVGGNLLLIPLAIMSVGGGAYGAWMLCFGFVSIFAVADLGVGAGLIRQLSHYRAGGSTTRHDDAMVAGFRIFTGLAIVAALLVPAVGAIFLQQANGSIDTELTVPYLALCGVGAFLALLGRFYIAVQHSFAEYAPERLLAVAGIAVRFIAISLSFTVWNSPLLIAASEVIAVAITCLGSIVIVRLRQMRQVSLWSGRAISTELNLLMRQSLPTFASAFATVLAMNTPFYVLGATEDFATAAAFGAVTRLYTAARTVIGWTTMPLLPAVSSSSARHGSVATKEVLRMYSRTAAVSVGLGSLVAVPLVAFPSEVLDVWLGTASSGMAVALACIGVAILAMSRYAPAVVLITALGRPSLTVVSNLAWLLLTAGLSIMLIPSEGAAGAGTAVLLPAVLALEFGTWRASRHAGASYVGPAISGIVLVASPVVLAYAIRIGANHWSIDVPGWFVLPMLLWAVLVVRLIHRARRPESVTMPL